MPPLNHDEIPDEASEKLSWKARRRIVCAWRQAIRGMKTSPPPLAAFMAFLRDRGIDPRSARVEDLARVFLVEAGCPKACEDLFLALQARLILIARAARTSVEEAADALQDLSLETCRSRKGISVLAGYEGRGSLEGFLKVILVRRLVRRARRDGVPVHDDLPSGREDRPDVLLAGDERRRILRGIVREALGCIGARERELILAHHVDGTPIVRAAFRLGLAEGKGALLRVRASRVFARAMADLQREVLAVARRRHGWTSAELRVFLQGDERDSLLQRAAARHIKRRP